MDLQQLTTFRTIAVLGSFSQAAELLGYAQSTVSEQIKKLEAELQTRLFSRAGSRQVSLTPAGEVLLDYAKKMSNMESEIRSEVSKPVETRGSYSIRVPETVSIFYLPPILKQLHLEFPAVNISCMNCVYFDLDEELRAGTVNLGFLITDTFDAKDLETEVLGQIPLVLVTYPAHPLASSSSVDLSQMESEPLIAPANDCSYVTMLERVLTEQRIKLPLVWHFNSLEAIKQVVMVGTGYAVLPEIAVREEVTQGRLIVLPWRESQCITGNLLMIWPKNSLLPPAMEMFIKLVRQETSLKSGM